MNKLKLLVVGILSLSVLVLVRCGTDDDDLKNPLGNTVPVLDPENGGGPGNGGGTGNDGGTDYGVGPGHIPAGDKKTGSSGLEDGSTARLDMYGVPQYFWGDPGTGTEVPLVKITHAVTEKLADMEITFNPGFVDNSYGTGSVGWSPRRGHTFRDLVGSDHVEIAVTNGNGDTIFHGRLDLISATTEASSGYAALGPFGGDGKIYKGDPSIILSFGTTLCDNINYYGYELFVNSPPTDSEFSPNAQYPNWQYYVSYRLTLDITAFGLSGYGEVHMTSVHASPAKTPEETITVTDKPGPVPGTQDDPFKNYKPTLPLVPGTNNPEPPKVPVDTVPKEPVPLPD